jgi:hypothetical protein
MGIHISLRHAHNSHKQLICVFDVGAISIRSSKSSQDEKPDDDVDQQPALPSSKEGSKSNDHANHETCLLLVRTQGVPRRKYDGER